MDRNTITGFVMMLALLVVYFLVFDPGEDAVEGQGSQSDSTQVDSPRIIEESALTVTPDSAIIAQTAPDSASLSRQSVLMQEKYGSFAVAASGTASELVLKNPLLNVQISTKGGFPSAAVLSNYHSFWDSLDVSLWDPALSSMQLILSRSNGAVLNTADMYFNPISHVESASESQDAQLVLEMPTADPSSKIRITYSLGHDSYELLSNIELINLSGMLDSAPEKHKFVWSAAAWHKEKGLSSERQQSSVFFRQMEDDRDYLTESNEDEEVLENPLNWMSFKQHFFSAAVISDEGFGKGAFLKSYPPVNESDTLHTMHYLAELPLNMNAAGVKSLRFYLGPNDYKILKDTEVSEFHRIIDYGWGIFGWVNRNIVRPMFLFFSKYFGSYGIVILIVTIIIKLLLFPVTWKNYLSSAKMRVLKPEMDEINKKYEGKDAMEKQQAVMALYRETGVNPMAGCIPVLLQMPILYAMFRFFPASIELRQQGFLWADDLGGYDSILSLPFNIPLYGAHVSGFTLLMAISTFFYTRMSSAQMPTTNQPGMPNMKIIMNLFPIMMLFFFNSFAAGLSFYYFAANVISIGQMIVIKKYFIDEDKIHAKIQANKKKPKKKSAFQQRLQDMQKAQLEKTKKGKS